MLLKDNIMLKTNHFGLFDLFIRGIIKKRSTDYTLLFAILMSFIGGVCYAYEPLCLPHGLNKFYKLVTSEH